MWKRALVAAALVTMLAVALASCAKGCGEEKAQDGNGKKSIPLPDKYYADLEKKKRSEAASPSSERGQLSITKDMLAQPNLEAISKLRRVTSSPTEPYPQELLSRFLPEKAEGYAVGPLEGYNATSKDDSNISYASRTYTGQAGKVTLSIKDIRTNLTARLELRRSIHAIRQDPATQFVEHKDGPQLIHEYYNPQTKQSLTHANLYRRVLVEAKGEGVANGEAGTVLLKSIDLEGLARTLQEKFPDKRAK
ncbi:MAG: hypothetical protein C4523_18965 [Myxococcales bacterium]|nr:MAG: hypothetical protein C4523_18965 [Myxococcales bacterium]